MPFSFLGSSATYGRHLVHGEGRIWAETNCYTDVVLEMLHGMGHEPLAALPFTLLIDFDVDQWTFFKFRHADLETLYGLQIHELAPWRPLVWHVHEQVAAGRLVLVELDSYFLPDTAGTAYGLAHVKSTVAVNLIDVEGERLGYFHNQGYHELGGEDFARVFQTAGLVHERMLPPYIEFVKPLPGRQPLSGEALVEASVGILREQLAQRPRHNPFELFTRRFEADLGWLQEEGLEAFHGYSFATLRQYGACYELASTYLAWLRESGVALPPGPERDLRRISESTKTLQFKLARAVARRRAVDLSSLSEMAELWEGSLTTLVRELG